MIITEETDMSIKIDHSDTLYGYQSGTTSYVRGS